jgi:ATP-dependent DNA helicase RecQ
VNAVLAGRDALGVLPTGGGKTVCYLVPAMILDGLVLVVTPLISLMADQVRRAREVGVRAEYLSSTQTAGDRAAIEARLRNGSIQVLLVAPERLETQGFRRLLGGLRIRALVVDEAHCIAEWGHDFRPSYRAIGRVRRWVPGPCLALTATATPAVRREIVSSLRLRRAEIVVRTFDRPNLVWAVRRLLTRSARGPWLRAFLRARAGPAIVYCPSRNGVEAVGRHLAGLGWAVGVYHAGLPAGERDAVQSGFMEGRLRVVAATNAFGMGIDKADIRTVVHLAMPRSLEAFYQEAGRGGRDGEEALSVSLVSPGDRKIQQALLSESAPPPLLALLRRTVLAAEGGGGIGAGVMGQAARRVLEVGRRLSPVSDQALVAAVQRSGVPHGELGATWSLAAARRRLETRRLRSVWRYVRTRACRRSEILRYFGEESGGSCGGCDRCGGVPQLPPVGS